MSCGSHSLHDTCILREQQLTPDSLQKAAPKVDQEHLPELGAVLCRLSEIISAQPSKPAAEAKKRRLLKDVFETGERVLPVGVVLILADDSCELATHSSAQLTSDPIASWAIPLAYCLRDGNVAVLVTTARTQLASAAGVRVFNGAGGLEALPAVDAVVGPRDLIPSQIPLGEGGVRVAALETGPVPVLIDASVVKTPSKDAGKVPHEIERIAAQVRYLHGRAYVLVAAPLADLVAEQVALEPVTQLSGPPDAPGVYAFGTLDEAVDVACQLPAPATVIYAERGVAAAAAARCTRTVHINGYPATLVLGPYSAILSFVNHVEVTLNQMPRHWCATLIKQLKPRTTSYTDVSMRESESECGILEEKDPR